MRNIILHASNKSRSGNSYDWRQEIAAAHFLVTPQDGLQPILFRLFAKAFQSGNFRPLTQLEQLSYFPLLLKAYSDSQHLEWRANPSQLIHAIDFITSDHNGSALRAYVESLRLDLIEIANGVENWKPFEKQWLIPIKRLIGPNPLQGAWIADRIWTAVSIFEMNRSLSDWFELLTQAMTLFGDNVIRYPAPILFSDPSFLVNVHLEAIRLAIPHELSSRFRAIDGIGIPRALADVVSSLTVHEFIPLREMLCKTSLYSYDDFNKAIIDRNGLSWQEKLDYLLHNPRNSAAELTLATLRRNPEFNNHLNQSETQTAIFVASRAENNPAANEVSRRYAASDMESRGQFVENLLKWDRSDLVFSEEWWDPNDDSLMREGLHWLIANGGILQFAADQLQTLRARLAEFPLLLQELNLVTGES